MPNVTVTAADTATAMDEIWDRLGPDAMIVSTKKQHGKIVMEATTESTAKPAEPARASTNGFGTLFTNQMIGKTPHRDQDTAPPAESMAHQNELAGVRRDLAALQDMLTGMVLTDLDGINPALSPSTRVTLQRAGFSQKILQDLQTHYAGYSYSDGCERFLQALASQLVHPTSATILQKRLIFVVGASGTGRTTMVAKIAAMLRDQNPSKEIVLASLNGQNGTTNHQLQSFGRLLNLPTVTLGLSTPVEDFNKMTDYDFMVIDVASDSADAVEKVHNIQSHLGTSEVGTLLAIPGSTSHSMISTTIKRFHAIHPLVALTKLDECETKPAEFSALAENSTKIALLSGTKSVIDPAVFASENILLQYLQENFSHADTAPARIGSE
jgi:flagellar biosynthesis GTPase FlhF